VEHINIHVKKKEEGRKKGSIQWTRMSLSVHDLEILN